MISPHSIGGRCQKNGQWAQTYVVQVLDPCPEVVHHVHPLLVVLRVGVKVTVVAREQQTRDKGLGSETKTKEAVRPICCTPYIASPLICNVSIYPCHEERTNRRSSEPSVQSGRPKTR